MTAIRNRVDKMETESELKEMLSTAIAEWLETATVDRANYPEKYHDGIKHKQELGGNIYLQENWHRDGVIPTRTKHKHVDRHLSCLRKTSKTTVDPPMINLYY